MSSSNNSLTPRISIVKRDTSSDLDTSESSSSVKEDPLQSILPKVTFVCKGKSEGYYADTDFDCEVFHYCKTNGFRFTFVCPRGSKFNQRQMTCDYDAKHNVCSSSSDDDNNNGDDDDEMKRTAQDKSGSKTSSSSSSSLDTNKSYMNRNPGSSSPTTHSESSSNFQYYTLQERSPTPSDNLAVLESVALASKTTEETTTTYTTLSGEDEEEPQRDDDDVDLSTTTKREWQYLSQKSYEYRGKEHDKKKKSERKIDVEEEDENGHNSPHEKEPPRVYWNSSRIESSTSNDKSLTSTTTSSPRVYVGGITGHASHLGQYPYHPHHRSSGDKKSTSPSESSSESLYYQFTGTSLADRYVSGSRSSVTTPIPAPSSPSLPTSSVSLTPVYVPEGASSSFSDVTVSSTTPTPPSSTQGSASPLRGTTSSSLRAKVAASSSGSVSSSSVSPFRAYYEITSGSDNGEESSPTSTTKKESSSSHASGNSGSKTVESSHYLFKGMTSPTSSSSSLSPSSSAASGNINNAVSSGFEYSQGETQSITPSSSSSEAGMINNLGTMDSGFQPLKNPFKYLTTHNNQHSSSGARKQNTLNHHQYSLHSRQQPFLMHESHAHHQQHHAQYPTNLFSRLPTSPLEDILYPEDGSLHNSVASLALEGVVGGKTFYKFLPDSHHGSHSAAHSSHHYPVTLDSLFGNTAETATVDSSTSSRLHDLLIGSPPSSTASSLQSSSPTSPPMIMIPSSLPFGASSASSPIVSGLNPFTHFTPMQGNSGQQHSFIFEPLTDAQEQQAFELSAGALANLSMPMSTMTPSTNGMMYETITMSNPGLDSASSMESSPANPALLTGFRQYSFLPSAPSPQASHIHHIPQFIPFNSIGKQQTTHNHHLREKQNQQPSNLMYLKPSSTQSSSQNPSFESLMTMMMQNQQQQPVPHLQHLQQQMQSSQSQLHSSQPASSSQTQIVTQVNQLPGSIQHQIAEHFGLTSATSSSTGNKDTSSEEEGSKMFGLPKINPIRHTQHKGNQLHNFHTAQSAPHLLPSRQLMNPLASNVFTSQSTRHAKNRGASKGQKHPTSQASLMTELNNLLKSSISLRHKNHGSSHTGHNIRLPLSAVASTSHVKHLSPPRLHGHGSGANEDLTASSSSSNNQFSKMTMIPLTSISSLWMKAFSPSYSGSSPSMTSQPHLHHSSQQQDNGFNLMAAASSLGSTSFLDPPSSSSSSSSASNAFNQPKRRRNFLSNLTKFFQPQNQEHQQLLQQQHQQQNEMQQQFHSLYMPAASSYSHHYVSAPNTPTAQHSIMTTSESNVLPQHIKVARDRSPSSVGHNSHTNHYDALRQEKHPNSHFTRKEEETSLHANSTQANSEQSLTTTPLTRNTLSAPSLQSVSPTRVTPTGFSGNPSTDRIAQQKESRISSRSEEEDSLPSMTGHESMVSTDTAFGSSQRTFPVSRTVTSSTNFTILDRRKRQVLSSSSSHGKSGSTTYPIFTGDLMTDVLLGSAAGMFSENKFLQQASAKMALTSPSFATLIGSSASSQATSPSRGHYLASASSPSFPPMIPTKGNNLHHSLNLPSVLASGVVQFPTSNSMEHLHQQQDHFPNPFPTVPLETFDFEAFKAVTEDHHDSHTPSASSEHSEKGSHHVIPTVFPPLNFNAVTGTFYEPIFGSHIPASHLNSDNHFSDGTNSIELPQNAGKKFPLFSSSTFKPFVRGLTGNHPQPISQSSHETFDRFPFKSSISVTTPPSQAKLVAYEYMYKPISMFRGTGTKRPPLRDRIPEPNTKVSYEKINLPVLSDTTAQTVYPTKPSYKLDNSALDSLVKIPVPHVVDKTSSPSFRKESSVHPIMTYSPNSSEVKANKGNMQDEGNSIREYLPFPPKSIPNAINSQKFSYIQMKPNVNYVRPPGRPLDENKSRDFERTKNRPQVTPMTVKPNVLRHPSQQQRPQQHVIQYHHHQLNPTEAAGRHVKPILEKPHDTSLHSADLPIVQYEVDPWIKNSENQIPALPQNHGIPTSSQGKTHQSQGSSQEVDVRPVFIPQSVKTFANPTFKKHRPLFPENKSHFAINNENNKNSPSKNFDNVKHHHPFNNNDNVVHHADQKSFSRQPGFHANREVMSTPPGINHHHHFQLQNLPNYHVSTSNNQHNGHLSHVVIEQDMMIPFNQDSNQVSGSNEADHVQPTTPPVFGQKIPSSGKKVTPAQVIKSMDDLYVKPPYTKPYAVLTTTQTPRIRPTMTSDHKQWYNNQFDRIVPQQEHHPIHPQPQDYNSLQFSRGPQSTAAAPTAHQERESQFHYANNQNQENLQNVPMTPQNNYQNNQNQENIQNIPMIPQNNYANNQNQENVPNIPMTAQNNLNSGNAFNEGASQKKNAQQSYDTRYNFGHYNQDRNRLTNHGHNNDNSNFWQNTMNHNQRPQQPIDEGRPEPEDVTEDAIPDTSVERDSHINHHEEQQSISSGVKTNTIKPYSYNRFRTTTTTTTTKRPTTTGYVIDLEEEDWEEDYGSQKITSTPTPVVKDDSKDVSIEVFEEPKKEGSLNLFKKRPDYTKLYSKYRRQQTTSTTTTTTTQAPLTMKVPTVRYSFGQQNNNNYHEGKISKKEENKENVDDNSNEEDKKNWGSRITLGKSNTTPRTSVSIKTSVSSSVSTYPYNPTKKPDNLPRKQFGGLKKTVATSLDSSQSQSDSVYHEIPSTTSTTTHPPSLKYNSPALNRFRARTSTTTTTTTTEAPTTPTLFVGKLGSLDELGLFDADDIGDDSGEDGGDFDQDGQTSNSPKALALKRIFRGKPGSHSITSRLGAIGRKLRKRVQTV